MALDTQVRIYSFDTSDFYTNRERALHGLNSAARREKARLVNGDGKRYVYSLDELSEILSALDPSVPGDVVLSDIVETEIEERTERISFKNALMSKSKDRLLAMLSSKLDANDESGGRHHVRRLRDDAVRDDKVISVFESYFTRTISASEHDICRDFMVVQVFYFDVAADMIKHGFEWNGERYVYFTSSAGQIRTKKCVFVREELWKRYEKTLMCGLTVDTLNERGGSNPNKFLAYLALNNSATDVWEEFDIDKSIVVDDFETEIVGTYDFVSDVDYSIERKTDLVPIPHTDGAGMMLPHLGPNRMVRAPWIKGLLGVFPFDEFIREKGCSPKIKDIYGKEYDIFEDGIEVVFTKSQFKMWKLYSSWDEYKECYKRYGCSTGYAKIEDGRIPDATINYQMLQTLIDISDEEVESICKGTCDRISHMVDSVESVKGMFHVNAYNDRMSPFQKAVSVYPDILNDKFAKDYMRRIKDSMVKLGKAGKLNVDGKYTFILPDFYAACEYWFLGDENPKGLLDDGEVFCWLFRKDGELDCLRSPHLYFEHAVRRNVACNEYGDRQSEVRRWFCTKALYTSTHDMISKVLMFDKL